MTEEKRAQHKARIQADTAEQLMKRFLWYTNNFDPFNEERCEDYELIKTEIIERMQRGEK